jgi:hypothetical protein
MVLYFRGMTKQIYISCELRFSTLALYRRHKKLAIKLQRNHYQALTTSQGRAMTKFNFPLHIDNDELLLFIGPLHVE